MLTAIGSFCARRPAREPSTRWSSLTAPVGITESQVKTSFARRESRAKSRGADHLVRYDREPFRDAVKRITDGRGADVVFDPVGGQVFEDSMRCIAWGARLLVIGFTGGIGQPSTPGGILKKLSIFPFPASRSVSAPALASRVRAS